MKKQTAVFIQAYIDPSKLDTLKNQLNLGGNPQEKKSFFHLEKLDNVHFARWIIAPATKKYKASLIYSGNIDGSVASHLEDLAEYLSEGLDLILSNCINYPSPSERNKSSRLDFLKRHSLSTPAFYVGAPNRTVKQIREESLLHEKVRDFVKRNRNQWQTSKEAYKAIRDFTFQDPELKKIDKNGNLPKRKGFVMILFLLLILVLLPLILVNVLIIFLFYESTSKPFGKTINDIPLSRLKELKDQEDIIYQNQLSQVFETKGGFRKLLLKFMLWATNFAAKNWFVEGELMGTPTIHFARWVFIDGGKRFVFFSNFDGSFDNYLGDFVDNNGWGLNAIYGAAKGYPKTRFVFGGGSYKILEFMGWGRTTQVPTPIWYSAYPWWGLQQIVDRTKLRSELLNNEHPSDEEMKKTLSRI